MTFTTIGSEKEGMRYFIDGYEVPVGVYDTFRPSKMFPKEPVMTMEQAEAILARIKAECEQSMPTGDEKPLGLPTATTANPWVSGMALAVHPSQIQQARERNRRHGLNIDYDKHGAPVCTDTNQRRKLMKIEKVRDRNSYYGY